MDPQAFDVGRKGFLAYEEYRAFALSMHRQPLDRKTMGSRIDYDCLRFRKTNAEGVFEFLSMGSDHISLSTLKDAVSRLDMDLSSEDIADMLGVFGSTVSREAFADAFE